MDLLGVCNSATILAQYEVNKNKDATKAQNIVRRNDMVVDSNVVPCWHIAPVINVIVSGHDLSLRPSILFSTDN